VVANLFLNIPGAKDEYAALIAALNVFPDFALRQTLLTLVDQKRMSNPVSSISRNFMKYYLIMMATIVVLGIILLYICENIYWRDFCWRKIKTMLSICKKPDKTLNGGDMDKLVLNGVCSGDKKSESDNTNYSVYVNNLEKRYSKISAVCGIDFFVRKGDCFGLLGMNGAGKTTTFNMMTQCETITNGSIVVNNISCQCKGLRYKSQIGYCPQVNALNPLLTSYETLKYFAWIRGVPPHQLPKTVDNWLKQLQIVEFRDRQVKYLSGGTKRKLNTAVAMLGDPDVIFLDEPTTGLDPKSRHFVCGCIKKFQLSGKAVVLTSQSLNECENLCNRLAIMIEGRLISLDNIQQQKDLLGKGFFNLTIKLKATNTENVAGLEKLRKMITEKFDGGTLTCLKYEHRVSILG
jgi:ATP-binding cassette, subfamily A (ABC1), member 3